MLDELEYEALQAEKRDKMQSRWQTWTVLGTLIGAFGLASLQSGITGYVVVLYPLLASCLATFTAHSEAILDQIKTYLYQFEEKHNYQGYEHYNRAHKRKSSGGHKTALLNAILLTDFLAITLTGIRMIDARSFLLAAIAMGIELYAIVKTWKALHHE